MENATLDLEKMQIAAEKACRLMKGFFDAMLSHPVTEAASALRQMASGERGSR